MRRIKVRGRNGVIREEAEGYVLCDGEAMLIPLSFMDARARHDPRRQRRSGRANGPAFLVRDNEADDQAVEAAYREYAATVSERWRQGPGQRSSPARSEPPQTFDNPEAARIAAYAQYNRDIQERWRK